MRQRASTTKRHVPWWQRIVILLALIINLVLLRSSWRATHQDARVIEEEATTEVLREEVATMQKRIVAYKTGILEESAIRDSLGYAKPSETVVILPPLSVESTGAAVAKKPPTLPIWRQWLGVLFGF